MEKNEIQIIYGEDIKQMAYKLCESSELCKLIKSKEQKIILKPNLVNSTKAENGATTHPEIIEGIIEYLLENNFENLVIAEGSWVGDSTKNAYRVCGYNEIRDRYKIRLIDTKKCKKIKMNIDGMDFDVVDCYSREDFLVNIPVMKGHCQTVLTCALKNMKGLITDSEKRRFHTLGLHKPIAYLNKAIRQDFIIADCICGDLDFEEGGNPVEMNMLFSACDPVLCDSFACFSLGIDISEVDYIKIAEKIGVGSANLKNAKIMQLNQGSGKRHRLSRKAQIYSEYIDENNACSACYGSLIHALSRMDRSKIKKIETICIGQGFKGKNGKLGVGNCTALFEKNIQGCPPAGSEILNFLENIDIKQ